MQFFAEEDVFHGRDESNVDGRQIGDPMVEFHAVVDYATVVQFHVPSQQKQYFLSDDRVFMVELDHNALEDTHQRVDLEEFGEDGLSDNVDHFLSNFACLSLLLGRELAHREKLRVV
jgi:hypothetical protein